MLRFHFVSASLIAFASSACHRTTHHEAIVEIERLSVVSADEAGRPMSTDVEISYTGCPGDQVEVIRGGAEFSACIGKQKVGDRVKAKIVHRWHPDGHYEYAVHELQGCQRPPDARDEDSFDIVRQCSDWMVNGTRVGFKCDYLDRAELAKECPWFKRR